MSGHIQAPDERGSSLTKDSTNAPALWTIHGKSYDLTEWADQHPGGNYLIDITQGTDCTELFDMYHSASLRQRTIEAILPRYEVGTEELAAKQEEPSVVYDELKEVVRQYRSEHGVKATDSIWACLWSIFWGIIHVYSLLRWASGSIPSTIEAVTTTTLPDEVQSVLLPPAEGFDYVNTILLGLSLWFWSVDIMHSGTHYALCSNARVSEWIGWIGGVLFHIPSGWVRQHVTGHHVHTNHHGSDPDLAHWPSFSALGLGWRVTVLTRMRPAFRRWGLSLVPIMTIAGIGPAILETLSLLIRGSYPGASKASDRRLRWAPAEAATAWLTWGGVLLLLAGVGYRHGVVHAVAPWGILGVAYYICSQVSHVNGLSLQHHEEAGPKLAAVPKEWAVSQILSAQGDYNYGSVLTNYLANGLNHQMVHHLFPTVHPVHYPALGLLFRPVLEKHQLPVGVYSQTFTQTLVHHIEHLMDVNQ